MTDKQNHFTYTDNTSDDNDNIMENLHKDIQNFLNSYETYSFTINQTYYTECIRDLAERMRYKW